MTSDLKTPDRSSMTPQKRPLAKRSCLKCREKKARCELPDLYVDSSKAPLPSDKQCHRCRILGIECVVWDGDRKRKPRLDPQDECSSSTSAAAAISSKAGKADRGRRRDQATANEDITLSPRRRRRNSSSTLEPLQSEQLAASEINHAQQLLLRRPKIWKALSRTFHALIDRLQYDQKYGNYLKLRIDAPPSTPDAILDMPPVRVKQLESQLQDYLVGHPYLPSLSTLREEQAKCATRPRALLLATLTLLGSKGVEDELISSDVRTLSSYIDSLGTQLLLSTPRDIHLVMAFELLLAHEPGLIGTGASQFEPEGRGFGLASENLFACAVKVARELGLDDAYKEEGKTSTKLARMSLWCCLRTWEGVYAFLGEKIAVPPDLDKQFASVVRQQLFGVGDDGKTLSSAPRLHKADGPTAKSFNEMREFCTDMEAQLGRDGILRSAGRSVLCLRLESTCILFSSLQELQETLALDDLTVEDRNNRIQEISRKVNADILMVRHNSNEHLGVYAGQRLVRVWEQLVHAECYCFCLVHGTYATAALFSGRMDGGLEAHELVRTICRHLEPHKHIAEVGLRSNEACRFLLAILPQMDRQPSRRRQNQSPKQARSRYLQRLPTLLVCAMAVHAARRIFEAIAFGLVAFAHTAPDAAMAVTLMESAAQAVRQLSPSSSIESVDTIAQVSADYIEEMIETARLWEVYYRVYRPVASIQLMQASSSASSGSDATQNDRGKAVSESSTASHPTTAMDFLADAAAAQDSGSGFDQTSAQSRDAIDASTVGNDMGSHAYGSVSASTDSWDSTWTGSDANLRPVHSIATAAPTSSQAGLLDASIFDASIPFDLNAFLRDVDQLF